jgi:hypothetical protein
MFRAEIHYFIVLSILILATPFLPSGLLFMLDNMVVRLAMIALLLFFIHVGPTAGLFGLIAIAVLYLERNRRKVGAALEKLDAMDATKKLQATVEEATTPQQTVPVLPFDTPSHEETDFLPGDDDYDMTHFEPVAPSINQKTVLASIYNTGSASASQHLYEQSGVGHLAHVETLGETA